MSSLFLKTLRESPSDAEARSHQLLVRAGYIRRAAPGSYTLLPLGLEVFRNVERIIRDEMVAAGAQEVHFPALLPKEPYEASNRWTEYGPNMFRLLDRKGADFLLAPTHEEMFTLLVDDVCSSYKDLPVSLFQIQTKYRDEARPRGGLLRGREFVMKDSYSFDLDQAGLQASYDNHRAAYVRIFDRLGLPYVIVSAVSGAMGGSASEEFLARVDIGEDTFVRCPTCGYAANTEALQVVAPPPKPLEGLAPAEPLDTPGTPTIESLVDFLNETKPERHWTAADTLKNLLVKLIHPDGTVEIVAIGTPGDREVDFKRLEGQVEPTQVEPFAGEDFAQHPALVRGYIGPTALGIDSVSGIRYLVDPRVVEGSAWVTGNNAAGQHVTSLVMGRDFTADGTIDVAEVRAGDACPNCDGTIELERGVEIGHIFQLGTRYAEALGLQVQDESGSLVTLTMGSYGIGVSRALAAVAETTADDLGLCWPRNVAPADVHVVIAGKEGGPQRPAAERLAAEFETAGIRVLFDDRIGVAPGVRFKDAELIGVPTIVVVGRGIDDGLVEVKDRRAGTSVDVKAEEVLDQLLASFAHHAD